MRSLLCSGGRRRLFDPIHAESAGIDLKRLLWVRCRQSVDSKSKSLYKKQPSSYKKQSSSNADAEISGENMPSAIKRRMAGYVPQTTDPVKRMVSLDEQPVESTSHGSRASQEILNARRKVLGGRGNDADASTRNHKSYSSKANNSKKQKLNPLEQAFKAADILIQNGGFGLIAVDLRSIETKQLAKVPLTTWFRFARVAEKTQTSMVFLTNCPAQNCAGATLHMEVDSVSWSDNEVLRAGEGTPRQAFDEATGKDFWSGLGYSTTVTANQAVSQHRKGTSDSEEVLPARSGSGRRKSIVSHAQTIQGAEYAIDMKRGRKPVQSSTPKFRAVSKWK